MFSFSLYIRLLRSPVSLREEVLSDAVVKMLDCDSNKHVETPVALLRSLSD